MPKNALKVISILKTAVGKDTACEPINDKPVTHEYRVGVEGIDLIYGSFDVTNNRWNVDPKKVIEYFGKSAIFCDEIDAIGYADSLGFEVLGEGPATFDIITDFQDRTFQEITSK